MDEWMDDGRRDGWKDGQMGGWMERKERREEGKEREMGFLTHTFNKYLHTYCEPATVLRAGRKCSSEQDKDAVRCSCNYYLSIACRDREVMSGIREF